ncbi:hypothetical protein JX265_011183 [Neoarthrinium moseri]|uniref:Uncharacterized protein n=1 Tax=Neoarthrinium moseri TaxID=1658444 RepID=A0A9P9WCK3_9PEZI|nr:hypothetical protein JX265_011183 [Neoarthrinium moseri]
MTQGNEELLVKGWKEVAQKLQPIWGDKHSQGVSKLRFQQLRVAYLKMDQTNASDSSNSARGPSCSASKLATSGERRASPKTKTTSSEDGADHGDCEEDGGEMSKKRARKTKAQAVSAGMDQFESIGAVDES